MYESIKLNKFETKADDFERGLEPIMVLYSKIDTQVLKIKTNNFLKYGRKGKPHARNVYLSENEETVIKIII